MSCVFCEIVAGTAPAIRIYEDDDYLAILDIRPFTRGHTLVIPKQHTVDLTDTPPETLADMVAIGQRIGLAARASELGADGNNIAINDGKRRVPVRVSRPPACVAPARAATSWHSPRAWCCAATRTAKRPAASCATHWRGSTPSSKTDAMDVREWVEKNVGGRILRLHDRIYQKTEGRIGHKIPGVPPSLLLHTTGAKTGQPRTNSLTYARDGDAYLIVASNGGSDRNPGLVPQPARQSGRRNQRRPKAIRCHLAAGAPRPTPTTADVADRQQEQRGTRTTATSARRRGRSRSSS